MRAALQHMPQIKIAAIALALASILSACSGTVGPPNTNPRHDDLRRDRESTSVLTGEQGGGINLFSNLGGDRDRSGGSGIGVNSFLWRATLDTLSFMPLASADPFGGVIITDWYESAESSGERLKVNIVILGRRLQADALRTSVFRQVRDEQTGQWRDAAVSPETARKLENAILARARELRTAQRVD